jgi:hypothetical protein
MVLQNEFQPWTYKLNAQQGPAGCSVQVDFTLFSRCGLTLGITIMIIVRLGHHESESLFMITVKQPQAHDWQHSYHKSVTDCLTIEFIMMSH